MAGKNDQRLLTERDTWCRIKRNNSIFSSLFENSTLTVVFCVHFLNRNFSLLKVYRGKGFFALNRAYSFQFTCFNQKRIRQRMMKKLIKVLGQVPRVCLPENRQKKEQQVFGFLSQLPNFDRPLYCFFMKFLNRARVPLLSLTSSLCSWVW